MKPENQATLQIAGELFQIYPDYPLCRTLAENISVGQIDYSEATQQLAARRRVDDEASSEIKERLESRQVESGGTMHRIKDISVRQLSQLDDAALTQVLSFYLKHPYAHNRTKTSRWLPQLIRSFFLRVLVAHARRRNLDLEYQSYFELLRVL
jgi:hypothetical protein